VHRETRRRASCAELILLDEIELEPIYTISSHQASTEWGAENLVLTKTLEQAVAQVASGG
jgi:hypothetical protein